MSPDPTYVQNKIGAVLTEPALFEAYRKLEAFKKDETVRLLTEATTVELKVTDTVPGGTFFVLDASSFVWADEPKRAMVACAPEDEATVRALLSVLGIEPRAVRK